MTSRGKWLESAVEQTNARYLRDGTACVQVVPVPAGLTKAGNFYRSRSTVDFVGVAKGFAVAFDCKVTKAASLPHRNVHDHQISYLENFDRAGGIAGLIVAFHDGPMYFCTIGWYLLMKDELSFRKSIPDTRFRTGSLRPEERCYLLRAGETGVAVPYMKALDQMRRNA